MKNNQIFVILLFGLLLFSGCISGTTDTSDTDKQTGVTTDDSSEDATTLYGGNLFSENSVSVCKVISDSEVEELFGFEPESFSHEWTALSLEGISTTSKCTYSSCEDSCYGLEIRYRTCDNSETYNYFTQLYEGEEGTIDSYEYVYSPGVVPFLYVQAPDSNTIITFTVSTDFPNITKEKIIGLAELFLSRVDPSLEQNHDFTPASKEMLNYEGNYLTFKYPKNWIANPMYSGSDDKISLEDSDGIPIMIIGTGSASLLTVEQFETLISTYESQGIEVIYSSNKNNNEGSTIIASDEKNGAMIYHSGKINDELSLFVLGEISDKKRYEFYESEITSVLDSIEIID